jgi:hypothetical protein
LIAVADWAHGERGEDEKSMWQFGDQDAVTDVVPIIDIWQLYKQGVLPYAGGWAEQPLHVLALIGAVDLVFSTAQSLQNPDFNFNDLTVTQNKLVSWLEKNRS